MKPTLLVAVALGACAVVPGVAVGDWTWELETVADGTTGSIAVDAEGNPHIAYTTPFDGGYHTNGSYLRYAKKSSGSWQDHPLNNTRSSVGRSGLKLDADGHPHIAYATHIASGYANGIHYVEWCGSSWMFWDVKLGSYFGGYLSLALTSDDEPRMASHDQAARDLWYSTGTGAGCDWSWNNLNLTPEGVHPSNHGINSSIALDSDGNPYIAYLYEETVGGGSADNHLGFACYDPNDPQADVNGWVFEVPDPHPYSGDSVCLVLDSQDRPRIIHVDAEHDELRYVTCTGNAWNIEVISALKGSIDNAWLALDSCDRERIVYEDGGTVKYAAWTGSEWDISTVAPGHYPALALDGLDNPRIVFTQGQQLNAQVVYAVPDGCDDTESWEYVSPLNTGRQRHGAALGSDCRIYAAGGYGPHWPEGDILSSVEAYDPATGQWTYVAELNEARTDVAVTADATGRIYAVGGTGESGYLGSMERYDPAHPDDGWVVLAPMPTPRGMCKAVYSAGKIYVIGGIAQPSPPWETTGLVEAYDVGTGMWGSAPSLNVERAAFGAGVDTLGRIWVFGGATDNGVHVPSVERYDPSIIDPADPDYGWHIIPELNMSPARHIGAFCTDDQGLIYALGGWAPGHLNVVEYFDPLDPASGWQVHSYMNRFINNFAAALDCCGRLYAIGGERLDSLAEVERFGFCDCNENGNPDECDIAEGSSQDENCNGIPDECELAVALDIKPGSCPNSFNRRSRGVLPVGLLGTAGFDVTQVDLFSIVLSRADGVGGGAAPLHGPPGPHSVVDDVGTPFDGEPCDCHELTGDGIDDLSMKFKTQDVVDELELNSLDAGAEVELVVSGTLLDGTPFEVSDCIQIVPAPGMDVVNLSVGSHQPDTYIEVTPWDVTTDGSGFTPFDRSYAAGTVVTLTAPPSRSGSVFARWKVNSVPQPSGLRTIQVPVNGIVIVEAVYKERSGRLTPVMQADN